MTSAPTSVSVHETAHSWSSLPFMHSLCGRSAFVLATKCHGVKSCHKGKEIYFQWTCLEVLHDKILGIISSRIFLGHSLVQGLTLFIILILKYLCWNQKVLTSVIWYHLGYVLVHGQTMVKGPVDFMLVIAMNLQSKRAWWVFQFAHSWMASYIFILLHPALWIYVEFLILHVIDDVLYAYVYVVMYSMMKLRGGGRWPKTLWRDTHITMSVGQPINRYW